MKIEIEIPDSIISSTIDSALSASGGCLWCDEAKFPEVIGERSVAEFLLGDGTVTFVHDEVTRVTDNILATETTINRSSIEAGLSVLAKTLPHHFADLLNEEADSQTGEYLLQCALFGEVAFE